MNPRGLVAQGVCQKKEVKSMDKNLDDIWCALRARYYGECAQKLLLTGHFRAAAVVLDWMDQEVAKLDH